MPNTNKHTRISEAIKLCCIAWLRDSHVFLSVCAMAQAGSFAYDTTHVKLARDRRARECERWKLVKKTPLKKAPKEEKKGEHVYVEKDASPPSFSFLLSLCVGCWSSPRSPDKKANRPVLKGNKVHTRRQQGTAKDNPQWKDGAEKRRPSLVLLHLLAAFPLISLATRPRSDRHVIAEDMS